VQNKCYRNEEMKRAMIPATTNCISRAMSSSWSRRRLYYDWDRSLLWDRTTSTKPPGMLHLLDPKDKESKS